MDPVNQLIVMKLILSFPLIWILFSSAEALKCVQDVSLLDDYPCDANEQCVTYAYHEFRFSHSSEKRTKRTCLLSTLCNQTLSLGIDSTRRTAAVQCCSTDRCNDKDIPFVDKQKPNGLQCFTKQWTESELVKYQCVGNEDRCISLNYTSKGTTSQLYGCASANLCQDDLELKLGGLMTQVFSSDLSRFSVPQCCDTNLCNSASAAKLSVFSLLLGFVALSAF